jgi:hypothetical protein
MEVDDDDEEQQEAEAMEVDEPGGQGCWGRAGRLLGQGRWSLAVGCSRAAHPLHIVIVIVVTGLTRQCLPMAQ